MKEERKYVRVYYSIIDDERFKHVYGNNNALATWLRLLLDADALWPASASLPRSVPGPTLKLLTDSGLIEVAAGRFRVHGLDAERQRRSEVGRAGGLASGRSRSSGTIDERTPNGGSTSVQRTLNERRTHSANEIELAEQRRAETSRAETSNARADFLAAEENDGRTDLDAFVDVRRRIPTPAQRALMDDYCATFDQTGPARAAQLIYANPDDPIGVLKADLAAFREERRAAAVAADVPKPIRRKGSGLSSVGEELAKMFREQDAAREPGGAA